MQDSLILPSPGLQSRKLAARPLHGTDKHDKRDGNGEFDAPWHPSVKQALAKHMYAFFSVLTTRYLYVRGAL
jgi:hypothetical protein